MFMTAKVCGAQPVNSMVNSGLPNRASRSMLVELKKLFKQLVAVFSLCEGITQGLAAPFVNLDFEAANTNTSQIEYRFGAFFSGIYGTGPTADLFPGWTVLMNGSESNSVAIGNGYYHWPTPNYKPGQAALGVPDGQYFSIFGRVFPREGKYSLFIDLSRDPSGFTPVYLSQQGEVPTNALFLVVHAAAGNIGVSLSTENFEKYEIFAGNTWALNPGDPYALYADVSAWAGKAVTLRIGASDEQGCVVDGLEFVGSGPLHIDPKLQLLNGGLFSFFWIGEVAAQYQVEASTNMPPLWFPVASPATSTNRIYTFTDKTVSSQLVRQRFYRLRKLP
ncbi:MAG: hypothetical protein HY043_00325 [Verrucomicrobia bacterium]|nr:hypothetical protein [Verrucomicrobiota bacterium]